jgi:hypothetical protein
MVMLVSFEVARGLSATLAIAATLSRGDQIEKPSTDTAE